MRALALTLVALCAHGGVSLLVNTPRVHAAPVVKVRARTEIVMEPVRRRWDGVEVRGKVIDQFSGAPMADAPVTARMNGVSKTDRTDGDGQFTLVFDVPDGRYDISLGVDDQEYFTATTFELGGVDVSKQSLELTVRASNVAYSKSSVEVVVQASVGGVGVAIGAELYAGPAQGELAYLGKITTDESGAAMVNIDRERLGAPGRKRIQTRFLGNRAFNPAEAEADLLLSTDTRTSMTVADRDIPFEEELTATGRVVDSSGQGVAGAPVALMVGTRRIAQALTGDDGSFRLRTAGEEIGAGTFNVQAVFEPSQPWHEPSRSELAQVQVAEPQPVPVAYTLAAFGATALAMMAFLGLRTRPWQTWLARLRRQRGEPESTAHAPQPGQEEIVHGLVPARPSLVSTLRRPNEHDITGTVRDAVRGRAIAGALVHIRHPEAGERSAVTDHRGEFSLTELAGGEWSARVSAHGFVTETFAVTIPHRGELRGARVDLVPVREKIFAIYREVAEPLLPASDLWGIFTPRQIFDHVREARPTSALATLTDFVEEAYFSQRTPAESILDHAQALVAEARAEDTDSAAEPVA